MKSNTELSRFLIDDRRLIVILRRWINVDCPYRLYSPVGESASTVNIDRDQPGVDKLVDRCISIGVGTRAISHLTWDHDFMVDGWQGQFLTTYVTIGQWPESFLGDETLLVLWDAIVNTTDNWVPLTGFQMERFRIGTRRCQSPPGSVWTRNGSRGLLIGRHTINTGHVHSGFGTSESESPREVPCLGEFHCQVCWIESSLCLWEGTCRSPEHCYCCCSGCWPMLTASGWPATNNKRPSWRLLSRAWSTNLRPRPSRTELSRYVTGCCGAPPCGIPPSICMQMGAGQYTYT